MINARIEYGILGRGLTISSTLWWDDFGLMIVHFPYWAHGASRGGVCWIIFNSDQPPEARIEYKILGYGCTISSTLWWNYFGLMIKPSP